MKKTFLKCFILLTIFVFLSGQFVLAQTNQTSSEQSTAGGKAESSSFKLISTIGQPSPVGLAGSAHNFLSAGLISTFIDTLIVVDVFPPLAPVDLSPSPAAWTNINDFSVSWTNPEVNENIAGAFHKVGEPPTNNDDGDYDENDITDITGISVDGSGEYEVYVWLKDVSNNYSYLNAAHTTLKYDGISPEIQHTPVVSQGLNNDITITAASTDQNSGVRNTILYYRKTGDVNNLGSVEFDNNTAVIPVGSNTQRGVEYAIVSKDSANNQARLPEAGYYSIQIELTGNGGVELSSNGLPVVRHHGAKVSDYRIFSVPFVLDDKRPSAVLEDDLGSYDDTKWKLFAIENTNIRDYQTIKNLTIVEPGRGFLLIVNIADKYIYAGSGNSPNVGTYNQIQLSAGWNLIGNPFDFDIPLDSLELNGSIPEAWNLGSSGWSSNPGYLEKWGGLAIYTSSSGTLNIGSGSGKGYKMSIADNFRDENWGIRITAVGNESEDLDNYIGIYTSEVTEQKNVWREPPVIAPSVSLAIDPDHPQFAKTGNNQNDRLSTFIQEEGESGNYWDLILSASTSGENIKLNFEKYGSVPDVYLLDRGYKVLYNLAEIDWKLETRTSTKLERHFRIIVGDENYIETKADGISTIPVKFALKQNFPNPFNPATNLVFTLPEAAKVKLEVYNLLGQKIRTLINGKYLNPGYYVEEWDGRSDNGQFVGSGIYLIRFSAGSYSKIRKGILVK